MSAPGHGAARAGAKAAPASERSCSGCDLCCTVLRVDELHKLGGVPCVHLRSGAVGAVVGESWGCAIHQRRPAICRDYRCLWLRGGLGADDRPDRLGAVLDVVPEAGAPYLAIRELAAGVFDASPRLKEIADEFRATMPVRITSAEEVMNPDRPYRVLQAGGAEQRIAGEWIASYEDGERVSLRRMPWLERTLRRLQLAAVSFKLERLRRPRDRSEPGGSARP